MLILHDRLRWEGNYEWRTVTNLVRGIRLARRRRVRKTQLKVENYINLSGGKNDADLFEVPKYTLVCK